MTSLATSSRVRRVFSPALVAALVLGVLAAAPAAQPSASLDAVLAPYFRIQAQLADDKADTVKGDADELATAAASLGPAGAPLAAAARELSAASGLAPVREAFGKVSDALIAYTEATQAPVGTDTSRVYCPMARKSWLQKGDSVRNPYFGKGMLGCGVVQKRG